MTPSLAVSPRSVSISRIKASPSVARAAFVELYNASRPASKTDPAFIEKIVLDHVEYKNYAEEVRRTMHVLFLGTVIFGLLSIAIAACALFTSVELSGIAWVVCGVLVCVTIVLGSVFLGYWNRKRHLKRQVNWAEFERYDKVTALFQQAFRYQWENLSDVQTPDDLALYIEADVKTTLHYIEISKSPNRSHAICEIGDPELALGVLIQLGVKLNLFGLDQADKFYPQGTAEVSDEIKERLVHERLLKER